MSTEVISNRGNLLASKEILLRDLKRVVSDADDLVKQVASSSADEFATRRAGIEERLAEARSRINDLRTSATRSACKAADAATGAATIDSAAKEIAAFLSMLMSFSIHWNFPTTQQRVTWRIDPQIRGVRRGSRTGQPIKRERGIRAVFPSLKTGKPRRISAAGLPRFRPKTGTRFYRHFRLDRWFKRGGHQKVPAALNLIT